MSELAIQHVSLQGISYLATAVAALVAAWTFRQNARRERARWAVQLYEKYFEGAAYKAVREALDCDANVHAARIEGMVAKEQAEFTDYLNFFELVVGLVKAKQLKQQDVLNLFQYYLACLCRHASILEYIRNEANGYELLGEFLDKNWGRF